MTNGGWTVILNSVPQTLREMWKNKNLHFFDRDITQYKQGFGQAQDNFWLGLEPIRSLLSFYQRTELRVRVGNDAPLNAKLGRNFGHERNFQHHATYWRFTVGDEQSGYELSLGERYDLW